MGRRWRTFVDYVGDKSWSIVAVEKEYTDFEAAAAADKEYRHSDLDFETEEVLKWVCHPGCDRNSDLLWEAGADNQS